MPKTSVVTGHYDHVLECLANIVPLFLDQPELLMTSSDFIKIVQQVISVDQTFLKMARDLVVTDFPGPVLKEFVNMIAYQLKNFAAYRRKSPLSISILWISVLSEIPGWMTNKNLMYVMEYCCQVIDTIVTNKTVPNSCKILIDFYFYSMTLVHISGCHGHRKWASTTKSFIQRY